MFSVWWPGFVLPPLLILAGLLHWPPYRGVRPLSGEKKTYADALYHRLLWQVGAVLLALVFMVMRSVVRVPVAVQQWMAYASVAVEVILAALLAVPVERSVAAAFGDGSVTEEARAKVNLLLAVGHRRDDGYHDLVSVMQTVDVSDTVTVTAHTGGGITMTCDDPSLPADGTNLAFRAAEVFFARTGLAEDGVRIDLKKRLPMQAGLGGGSTDGAAVLRCLRTLYAPELSDGELERMAAELGSDVPFCVKGGTALALGRGEQLSPLPGMPDCWFVLVKPEEAFSTGKMYGRIDELGCFEEGDPSVMTDALARGDLAGVCAAMGNTFERVVPPDSAVPAIRDALLAHGALGAMLSGSGSAVFGVFAGESQARRAAQALQATYPRTFLARNWQ